MNTTAPASTTAYLRSLDQRIGAVRRSRSMVRTTTGIASAIGLLAGAITGECLLDELVELPWTARALILLAILSGSGWLLWRDSIQPFLKRAHDDAIALMIEHALPVFRTRFIASIQLARVFKNEQPVLVRALLAETASTALRVDFGKVVKTRRMRRSIIVALAVLSVAGCLGWYGKEASVLLLKRALLFNIRLPHKTQILKITGDMKIGIGEDCNIDVKAAGILPTKGTIVTKSLSGDIREFDLIATPGARGQYSALIHAPQESFTYHVKLNDDTSDTCHVTTMQRPAVAGVECRQIYPTYIKRPPIKRNAGDLTLLAGSKLQVTARTSVPVKKATLLLAGLSKEIPMRIDSVNHLDVSGEFDIPVKDLTGFSVRLMSMEGVESSNTAIYHIEIVPDREPTLKFLQPVRREELAVNKAKVLIAFELKDDFGIARADIHYTVDGADKKPVAFDFGGSVETLIKRHFDWDLGEFNPPLVVGNVIEFWMTVQDTNTVTGPGIGTTEHYQIKIVTSDEKLQELANRRHEVVTGVGEVTHSEEELNKDIGEPIFAAPQ